MNHFDVIVIGGGAVGLSTGAALAKTNKRTLVVEQFDFFNQKGSSAGMSRQFRVQYAQKYMAQLALDAVPYWDELQQTTSEELIDKVGSLWFGDPALDTQEGGIKAAMRVMDELDIPYTKLDAKTIQAKYPFKDLPEDYEGFFQADGGIINLSATLHALYKLCDAAENIELRDNTTVTSIDSREDGTIVLTAGSETFSTEKLVICPGAFINDTLASLDLSIDIDIWEMSSAYYKKVEDVKLPTWFVFQEPQTTSLFYGFPEVDWDNPGYFRVAPDIPDKILKDPSERNRRPSAKSLKLNSDWVKDHMVGIDPTSEIASTCLITLSENGKELLLDHLPEGINNNKNIWVYTGGWAAKFIPLLGHIMADLAQTGQTEYDISNFNINFNHTSADDMVQQDLKNPRLEHGLPENRETEVAIIGSGVSGLYSAYRLTNDEKFPMFGDKVQIFDMGDRIGGRLESVTLPGMTIAGELGGMRYMTSQEIVTSLIENVFKDKLDHIDFPMGDPANLFAYYRKQRVMQNAWDEAQACDDKLETRYFLNDDDVGFSGDQLFNKVVYNVLAADPWFMTNYPGKITYDGAYTYGFELTRQEWNEVKPMITYNFEGPYKGLKVNNMGFWNLIKDQVSEEGFNFLANAGGYYSNTVNWNAAEAFPYMVGDFSNADTSYRTIDGGYDLIAYALAQDYLSKKGANIWMGNRLVTFSKNSGGDYKYTLEFFNEDSKSSWTLQANKIVLAMPRRSLELLDQNNFFFDRDTQSVLQKNMASAIIEPSIKILMGFEYPWWQQDFETMAGHSITDLPIRQCYYFGKDPNDSHSMLLGSYNDMRTVTFWQALADNRDREGPALELFQPRTTKLVGHAHFNDKISENQATKVMVAEAMNQVRELHGDENIPDPYVTWYKDWTADPYGGGYHVWHAHYNIEEVMRYMRQPNKAEDIHICGEAYSDQQGWVEGAFCVAENMLEENFNLTRPSWIPKDYYLGW
jgi:glycine/D-amino acid oxidase-like deaminating enzyme/monoamine oxidase